MRQIPQLLDRLVDLEAEAVDHLLLLRRSELLADQREVHAQRDEPLLRAVVEIALDAAALGVTRLHDPCPRRPQLALQRAVLDGEQRGRRRSAHELRILRQRLLDHHRGHRLVVAVDRHPGAVRFHGRRRQGMAGRLQVLPARRLPVRQPQCGVVERLGHRVAPLLGRRLRGEPLEQDAERLAGELLRLQQRDEESQRQQDPSPHDHPLHRLHRLEVDLEDPGAEVGDEPGRQEQERRHGDGEQRPPLGPGGPQQPHQVDDEHGGGERQRDVGLPPPRELGELRLGGDLERVGRAVGIAARERSATGDDG